MSCSVESPSGLKLEVNGVVRTVHWDSQKKSRQAARKKGCLLRAETDVLIIEASDPPRKIFIDGAAIGSCAEGVFVLSC